ncbi:MAG: hypothetical protein R3A48_07745 [Polyangiales bacterium]
MRHHEGRARPLRALARRRAARRDPRWRTTALTLTALLGACGGASPQGGSDAGVDAAAVVTRAPYERCAIDLEACSGGAQCAHVNAYGGDSGAYCAPPCGDRGQCPARVDGGFAMCVGERCVESCTSNACAPGFHCHLTGVPELRICLPDRP